MSASSSVPWIAILLLQLWGAHAFSSATICPSPCLCQKTPLLNCSSSGLSEAPSHIPATATALDLSHNALHSLLPLGHIRLRGLQHFWVGDNALDSLSMCLRKGVESTKAFRERKEWCVSWAPDLQLLSADRNQLKRLPRGLGSIKSLQVLHFTHNKISTLGPADLAGCTHLREVHLQHNLINTIHSQAFKDLSNLQVLDLSYNLLTIIPLPAYLSLRNLNALVSISGNRWRCDCNLKTIRRWLNFDNELGNPTWKVDCFAPSHHAGKDLLYLEESDLTCQPPVFSKTGLHTEVTLDEGAELSLSCGAASEGSASWWTPQGHFSDNQQQLFISNITEQHAGHYVCMSGVQEQHISVFNIHVRKKVHDTRHRREAQTVLDEEKNVNVERNVRTVSQSQFVLAVCLSVFITFIAAFVLGVLLRPLLDKLCQKIRAKRNSTSSSTNSRTSNQQRPYVNEGFSDTDEHVQEARVGSRVTFGGVTEVNDNGGNIPYFVTVEDAKSDSSSENNTDAEVLYENTQGSKSLTTNVITHVEMEDLRSQESSDPRSTIQVSKEVPLREANTKTRVEPTEIVEFEPIPDPDDNTELEERMIPTVCHQSRLPQDPQSFYEAKESVELSVDTPMDTTYDEEGNVSHEATLPEGMTEPYLGSLADLKEESVDDLDKDLWNDSGESFSFPDDSPRSSSRITQCADLEYPLLVGELSVDKQSEIPHSCRSSESDLTEGEQTEYSVNEGEELVEYHMNPVYRSSQKRSTSVSGMDESGASDPSEDEEIQDENENYPRRLEIKIAPEVNCDYVIPVKEPNSMVNINFDNSSSSTDVEDRTNRAEEMSGSQENVKPNTSFFGKLGQAFDQLPKVKKSLLFSVSDPQPPTEDRSTPVLESGSKMSRLNSSSEESFFGKFDATLGPVPKVKRYLQFSHSAPQLSVQSPSTSLQTESITPVLGIKTQSMRPDPPSENELSPTSKRSGFFEQVALDGVPKVKRYIQFSPSEPLPSVHSPSASLKTEKFTPVIGTQTQPIRSRSSEDGDGFFGQVGPSTEGVPKVKRYIQFTPSEAQPLSPSTPLKMDTVPPKMVPKTQAGKHDSSFKDNYSPTTKEENFFEQIGASLDGLPKVERYIRFSPSDVQPSTVIPSTLLNSERITPQFGTTVQSGRSDLQSKDELSPTNKGNSFFEEIGASLDEVPKVKRSIQFSQSETLPAAKSPSASLKAEKIPPVLGTQTQSKQPDYLPEGGDVLFGQVDESTEGVSKVKRYIQFTPTEVRPSSPSASLNTDTVPPKVYGKYYSLFGDNFSPTTKEENFFEQIGATTDGVPKVERYIQFSPSEPQSTSRSPSLSSHAENVTPRYVTTVQSGRSDPPSEDGLSSTNKGNSFFEQTGTSLDGVPKVKCYIQFSQSEPETSTLSPTTSLKTEKITPVLGSKTHSVGSDSSFENGGSIFGETGSLLGGVPKVKRYIQFSQSEPLPSSPSASLNTDTTPPKMSEKHDALFRDNYSPTIKEENFFEQTGTSLDGVPKVKRYIEFSQSEPLCSVQTPSAPLKTKKLTPVLGTQTQPTRPDYLPEDGDGFFGQVGASTEGVTKVKRYIQFTPSEEPLPPALSPSASLKTERIPPVSGTTTQPMIPNYSFEEGESFFGKIGPSSDGVPKVKRFIQFTPFEAQPPSPSLKTETITTALAPKTLSGKHDSLFKGNHSPTTKEENFFDETGASIDGLPKVKRYIQFSQSEPPPSALSSVSSLKTEKLRPVLGTQIQPVSPDYSSEDGDGLFRLVGPSSEGVPKVKRYIQFTPSEPLPSALSPSTSSKTERIPPVSGTTTQTMIPNYSSEEGESFFGEIGPSSDGVPKVKRFIQFTPFEAQPPSPSPSLKTETITTALAPKTLSGKHVFPFNDNHSPTTKEENFFDETGASIDGLPKVKRYIQFSQSEPPPSALSPVSSLKTETITTALAPKTLSGKHDSLLKDNQSPTTKEENFFEQIDASLDGVPKVQRYIQFSPSEVQPSALSPSTLLNSGRITPVLGTQTQSVRPHYSSEDGESFFGRVGPSTEGVPKVKRYIQFTPSEAQPSAPTQYLDRQFMTNVELQRSSSSPDDVKTNEDNFFVKTDASFYDIPKVKRYIQFTEHESPLGISSDNEAKPSSNKDTFLGGIYLSVDNLPTIKRSLQFTQSEPKPASPLPSPPELLPKRDSTSSKYSPEENLQSSQDNLFEQLDVSLDGVPKVSRYVQFSQTEAHPPNRSSAVDIHEVMKTQSSRSEDDIKPGARRSLSSFDMKVATETSTLDHLPRPKRTLYFFSDPNGKHDQSLTPQPQIRQRISHSQFDDEQDSNAYDSPPASPGIDDSKEYLRDSVQARQKQERRRFLFQQKRRAMDGFSLPSRSSTLDKDRDKQGSLSGHNKETIPVYSRHIFSGVSTGTAVTASNKDVYLAESEGLSARSISPLRYKYHSDV